MSKGAATCRAPGDSLTCAPPASGYPSTIPRLFFAFIFNYFSFIFRLCFAYSSLIFRLFFASLFFFRLCVAFLSLVWLLLGLLPGLLASLGMAGTCDGVDLYGPEPLEAFVLSALQHSATRIGYPLRFHPVEAAANSGQQRPGPGTFHPPLNTMSKNPIDYREADKIRRARPLINYYYY